MRLPSGRLCAATALAAATCAGARRRAEAFAGNASVAVSYLQREAAGAAAEFPLPILLLSLRAAAQCQPAAYHLEEPHEGPPCACGEDAFFVAEPTPSTAAIGVADGVGGWRTAGADPAAFAWGLMNGCRDAAEAGSQAVAASAADPTQLLNLGFTNMQQGVTGGPPGGSTACLASLDRATGELSIANLGDSGAMVIRDGQVVGASAPQQMGFNCPYQLSIDLDGKPGSISPTLAAPYKVKVQDGDLVLLMTDGVLDNLPTESLAKLVALMPNQEPDEIAKAIVRLAHNLSKSEFESPFTLAARAAGYHYPAQGKEDDITVVVARVEGTAEPRPGRIGWVRDARTKEARRFQRKKKKGTRRNKQRK